MLAPLAVLRTDYHKAFKAQGPHSDPTLEEVRPEPAIKPRNPAAGAPDHFQLGLEERGLVTAAAIYGGACARPASTKPTARAANCAAIPGGPAHRPPPTGPRGPHRTARGRFCPRARSDSATAPRCGPPAELQVRARSRPKERRRRSGLTRTAPASPSRVGDLEKPTPSLRPPPPQDGRSGAGPLPSRLPSRGPSVVGSFTHSPAPDSFWTKPLPTWARPRQDPPFLPPPPQVSFSLPCPWLLSSSRTPGSTRGLPLQGVLPPRPGPHGRGAVTGGPERARCEVRWAWPCQGCRASWTCFPTNSNFPNRGLQLCFSRLHL